MGLGAGGANPLLGRRARGDDTGCGRWRLWSLLRTVGAGDFWGGESGKNVALAVFFVAFDGRAPSRDILDIRGGREFLEFRERQVCEFWAVK